MYTFLIGFFLMKKIFCTASCIWCLLGHYKRDIFSFPAILLNLLICSLGLPDIAHLPKI